MISLSKAGKKCFRTVTLKEPRGEGAASTESKLESKVRDLGCFSPLPQSYFQVGEWGHSTASQPGHFYGAHSAEGKYKWLCFSHEVQGLKALKLVGFGQSECSPSLGSSGL